MQSENPLLADIAKLLNSAAGTMAGMGREARDAARERVKEAVGGLEFVSREEFDAALKAIPILKDQVARILSNADDPIRELYFVWQDDHWDASNASSLHRARDQEGDAPHLR